LHAKKEKLLLKFNNEGFTLIELLVVIAIIAILVMIALVAINPVERVRDSYDQQANADVIQVAQAIQVCVTKEVTKNTSVNIENACSDWDIDLVAGGYVSGPKPEELFMTTAPPGIVAVCAYKAGGHDGSGDLDADPDNAFFASNQTQVDTVNEDGSNKGSATSCP